MPPVQENLYSVTVSARLTASAVPPPTVKLDVAPAPPVITHDPAHELAATVVANIEKGKLGPAQNLKVRYPNMQHSFAEMFANIPTLDPKA